MLLGAALKELSVSETAAIGEHVKDCSNCSAVIREQGQLLAILNTQSEPLARDHDFVTAVMDRCKPDAKIAASHVGRKRSLTYAKAAVLAASALWLTQSARRSDWDGFTARGTSSHNILPVTTDVLLLRGEVLSPIDQAEIYPGDRIAVRYWNGGESSWYLAVFAIDSQSAVHWFFPAYLDASENPRSIPLARAVEGRLLDEVVEPDNPANGAFKIVALVTASALSVREIEAKLLRQSPPPDVRAVSPGSHSGMELHMVCTLKTSTFLPDCARKWALPVHRSRYLSISLLVCLSGLFSVLLPNLAAASPAAHVFALVVTNNKSVNLSQPDLQYADDDGARYYQLFRSLAAEQDVVLLTTFDRASAAIIRN